MNTLESLLEKVNEDHFQNDYKSSVLSDSSLRRKLHQRAIDAGLDISKLAMGEYGPCGSFAYRVQNSPNKLISITEAEHAALVAVAEAANSFNSRAFKIETCDSCEGTGLRHNHDACRTCGGTGELVRTSIFPDDLTKLHEAQANLAALRNQKT